jgi:NAD(P)-dependent dehydrogenase (short-subunit alcohol dehydrogenase family)
MGNESTAKAALVIGAGDAIGSAIMRAFARKGLKTVGVRRNGDKLNDVVSQLQEEGHEAWGWSVDARREEEIEALFERIENEIGELDLVVFNVGANVPMTILDTDSRKFFKIWEMACFAGFLAGREAARYMSKRGRGTIIFTGATASTRGAAGFGAFASAKHGLKAVAQSLAREMGPQNIHVAHVIIDAAVDTQWIRENDLPRVAERREDDIVEPDSIAANYVHLSEQTRDSWTFEMDLRPWCEKF